MVPQREICSQTKRKLYVLEKLSPAIFIKDIDNKVRNKYQFHVNDDEHITCVMLSSMSLEL